MASTETLSKPVIPDSRIYQHRRYDNPIQVLESTGNHLDDPYLITEAVRGAIDLERRVIAVKSLQEYPFFALIHSVSNNCPDVEGDIPGKDRPYAIFESLTPEDKKRISGK